MYMKSMHYHCFQTTSAKRAKACFLSPQQCCFGVGLIFGLLDTGSVVETEVFKGSILCMQELTNSHLALLKTWL